MLHLSPQVVSLIFGFFVAIAVADEYQEPPVSEGVIASSNDTLTVADLIAAIRLSQGIGWTMLTNKQEAIRCFDHAIDIAPRNATGYVLRAASRYMDKTAGRNEWDLAMADLDEAIRLRSAAASPYRARAYLHCMLGDFSKAIADCNNAIQLDPKDDDAYSLRGSYHAAMGDYAAAISDCNEAIRINPQNADAFYFRGMANAMQFNWKVAEADGHESLRLSPTDHRCFDLLINVFAETKDYAKALETCGAAITKHPNNSRFWGLRGQINYYLAKWDDAIVDLSEARRLDPESFRPLLLRAQCHLQRCDYAQAIIDCDEVNRFTDNAGARVVRARAHVLKCDLDEALKDCDIAIRLNPEEAAFYVTRASVYLKQNDYFRMERDYSEVIRLEPKNAGAYAGRGHAHLCQHERMHAIADCSEAIRLDPTCALARFCRAVSNVGLRNYLDAMSDILELVRRGQLNFNVRRTLEARLALLSSMMVEPS